MNNNNNNNNNNNDEVVYLFDPVPAELAGSAEFKKKIADLFLKINIFAQFLVPLARDRDNLSRFGLKTSHTLRAHFIRLAKKSRLSPEAILWVYLFCAKARSKDRIKAGIKTVHPSTKANSHFDAAARFVEAHMVTWPDQESEEKFATVHTPNTNPGLSFLLLAITDSEMTATDFLRNSWAPQINWDETMRETVESEAKHFWTKVVTTTTHGNRRTKRPEESRFNETIFETQWKDDYTLLCINEDGTLTPYKNGGPYKKADLDEYLAWTKEFITFSDSMAADAPDDNDNGGENSSTRKRPSDTDASGSGSPKTQKTTPAVPKLSATVTDMVSE